MDDTEDTALWIERDDYERDPAAVYSLALDEGETVVVHEDGEVFFLLGGANRDD